MGDICLGGWDGHWCSQESLHTEVLVQSDAFWPQYCVLFRILSQCFKIIYNCIILHLYEHSQVLRLGLSSQIIKKGHSLLLGLNLLKICVTNVPNIIDNVNVTRLWNCDDWSDTSSPEACDWWTQRSKKGLWVEMTESLLNSTWLQSAPKRDFFNRPYTENFIESWVKVQDRFWFLEGFKHTGPCI